MNGGGWKAAAQMKQRKICAQAGRDNGVNINQCGTTTPVDAPPSPFTPCCIVARMRNGEETEIKVT